MYFKSETIVDQVVRELKSSMEAYPIIFLETEDRELIRQLLTRKDCFSIYRRTGEGFVKGAYQPGDEHKREKEGAAASLHVVNAIGIADKVNPRSNYRIDDDKPLYLIAADFNIRDCYTQRQIIKGFIDAYDQYFDEVPIRNNLIIVSATGMRVGNGEEDNVRPGFDQYVHLISVPMIGLRDIAEMIVNAQNDILQSSGLPKIALEDYLAAPDDYIEGLKGMNRSQVRTILYQIRNRYGVISSAGVPEDMAGAIPFKALERYAREIIIEQKKQIARKSGVIEYIDTDGLVEPGNIQGIGNWIREQRSILENPILASEFGLRVPKGVLIAGLPGSGKSLTAKTISRLLGLPLIQFKMDMVLNSLMGESEQRLKKVLKLFEASAPCVIWIDEIEKEFSGMNAKDGEADGGVNKRCLAKLLNWMQENREPCFIAATANRTDTLPQELLRPGRIERLYYSFLPMQDQCVEIMQKHIAMSRRDHDLFDDSVNDASVREMCGELFDIIAQHDRQFFIGSDLEDWLKNARFQLFKRALREGRQKREYGIDDLKKQLLATLGNVVTYAQSNYAEVLDYWIGLRNHEFRNVAVPEPLSGDAKPADKYSAMLFDFSDLRLCKGNKWEWDPALQCHSPHRYDRQMLDALKRDILNRLEKA